MTSGDGRLRAPSGGAAAPARRSPLSAWYGEARVLTDVSVDVAAGRGRHPGRAQRCRQDDPAALRHGPAPARSRAPYARRRRPRPARPDARARAGIGWVPDDRGIYASLSVEENLLLPPVVARDGLVHREVYEHFPVLAERRDFPGTKLSGGEQQMLAMARVLRMGARLLLLDEPSEGLAPVIVQRIGEIIREIKSHGVARAPRRAERHLRALPSPTGTTCSPRAGSSSTSPTTTFAARESELLTHLGM